MKLLPLLLLSAGFAQTVLAEELPSSVRFFRQNQEVTLSEEVQRSLQQQILELTKSSNFHSGPGGHPAFFTFAGVQQDYREMVGSGTYLLATFAQPQQIGTQGGPVEAAEVVVGLPHMGKARNKLFTIDSAGRLVSHAKYGGFTWLAIDKIVNPAP